MFRGKKRYLCHLHNPSVNVKMKSLEKILFCIQLILLIAGILVVFLDSPNNVFALFFALPFVAISAILLLALIVFSIVRKRPRFALLVALVYLGVLVIGCLAIFFTSVLYVNYMSRMECDTIPYEMIPPRVVLPDSAIIGKAAVVHNVQYRRRSLFSDEFVPLTDDRWNEYNNGWYNYYTLTLLQDVDSQSVSESDITSTDLEIIGIPRDSLSYMGDRMKLCSFSYLHSRIPSDTIKIKYLSVSGASDTILLVKAIP